jgi:hypothetical protein
LREALGSPSGVGVLVAQVLDDSPASRAGLRAGDVIVRMDREPIHGPSDVYRVLDSVKEGDTIEVTWFREQAEHSEPLEIGAPPAETTSGGMPLRQLLGPGSRLYGPPARRSVVPGIQGSKSAPDERRSRHCPHMPKGKAGVSL